MSGDRAKISPDLVQHIFQYAWELRLAGAGAGDAAGSKKKFPVKDEAVVASAEVLRLFAQ